MVLALSTGCERSNDPAVLSCARPARTRGPPWLTSPAVAGRNAARNAPSWQPARKGLYAINVARVLGPVPLVMPVRRSASSHVWAAMVGISPICERQGHSLVVDLGMDPLTPRSRCLHTPVSLSVESGPRRTTSPRISQGDRDHCGPTRIEQRGHQRQPSSPVACRSPCSWLDSSGCLANALFCRIADVTPRPLSRPSSPQSFI